ncbi:hypothetical protein [Okeania sp. SIO3I5]|nr:hypothetical protein [Okeania sp. SIO3I5]
MEAITIATTATVAVSTILAKKALEKTGLNIGRYFGIKLLSFWNF